MNPSFETNTSWTAGYYSAPITRDTTSGAYGSASATTTTNSTTNTQGIILIITDASAGGVTYTCSVSYKGTAGTTVIYSGRANGAAGAYIGEGYAAKTLTLSGSWQRTSITFTTPANTVTAMVQARLTSPLSGVVISMDGLMCTTGSATYNYADGDSTDWLWNGTAHASTSTGPAL